MVKLRQVHWITSKHALRYLRGTMEYGLRYIRGDIQVYVSRRVEIAQILLLLNLL
jgi:hypothetical protein